MVSKGSGGRSAVEKLLGAEKKLTSMKERLEGLYSGGGIDGVQHGVAHRVVKLLLPQYFNNLILIIVGILNQTNLKR